MQDNVTQRAAMRIHGLGWLFTDGRPNPRLLEILDDIALASTAQPEVKALVEALEAIKAQTSAEDDAGENYRWDDREGALDFAYATAAQALTAYHEAQP